MGRLPLPRLPRRRRRSSCSPSRASRSAAISRRWSRRCCALEADRFVLDGELIIPVGGVLSFDALQLRLHPAESRIRKLAARDAGAADAVRLPRARRRRAVSTRRSRAARARSRLFYAAEQRDDLLLSPCTRGPRRRRGLARRGRRRARRRRRQAARRPYQPGERAMLKVKQMRTADCVVGGFRYATEQPRGRLAAARPLRRGRACSTMSASPRPSRPASRPALTRRLEALVEPPGFTGDAPGGPSRWSTERSGDWQPLRPELVAEVRYDHVTGDRFRHGTKFLRWRPDKAPGAMPDGPAPARGAAGRARRRAEGGVMTAERIVEGVRLSNPGQGALSRAGHHQGRSSPIIMSPSPSGCCRTSPSGR